MVWSCISARRNDDIAGHLKKGEADIALAASWVSPGSIGVLAALYRTRPCCRQQDA